MGILTLNVSVVGGLLKLLLQQERVTTCRPRDESELTPSGAFLVIEQSTQN